VPSPSRLETYDKSIRPLTVYTALSTLVESYRKTLYTCMIPYFVLTTLLRSVEELGRKPFMVPHAALTLASFFSSENLWSVSSLRCFIMLSTGNPAA
jgi:hypothetical protein